MRSMLCLLEYQEIRDFRIPGCKVAYPREMMMNPVSLEAGSAVVWTDAPRQGKPMLRGEPQEQALRGYAARARKKRSGSHEVEGGD
jgi:hypothetical protein